MKRTQVYFPKDLYTKMRVAAQKRGVSIAEIVRASVAKEIQNRKPTSRTTRRLLEVVKGAEEIARHRRLEGPTDVSARHNDYLVEDEIVSWKRG